MSREVCKKKRSSFAGGKGSEGKDVMIVLFPGRGATKGSHLGPRSTWTNITKPLPQPWIVQKKTEGIVLAQPRLPANLPGPTHVDHPVGRWLWKCRCGNAAAGGLVFQDLHCYIDDEQHEGDVIVRHSFSFTGLPLIAPTFWRYLGESFRRTKRLVENPLRALDGFMRLNWRAFMLDFLKLSWLLHLQVWSSPKKSKKWMAMVSSVYRQSQVELRKTPTGRCCCLMMSVQFNIWSCMFV